MVIDDRLLEEYAFDGVFYTYEEDMSAPLLEQEWTEKEVLRTKCDIQHNSATKTGFLDSDWAVYFPLEENQNRMFSETADARQNVINGDTWQDIAIKRGMYFRGEIYGYEVNGKVTGVGPSMMGGCLCYIKDVDE